MQSYAALLLLFLVLLSCDVPAASTLQLPVLLSLTGYRDPRSITSRPPGRSPRKREKMFTSETSYSCIFVKYLQHKAEMLFKAYETENWTEVLTENMTYLEGQTSAILPSALKSLHGTLNTTDTCLKLEKPWSIDFVDKFDRQLKLFLSILGMVKNDKYKFKDKYTEQVVIVSDAIVDLRNSLEQFPQISHNQSQSKNQSQAFSSDELKLDIKLNADDLKEVGGFISRQLVNTLRHVSKTCAESFRQNKNKEHGCKHKSRDGSKGQRSLKNGKRGKNKQTQSIQQRKKPTLSPQSSVYYTTAVNKNLHVSGETIVKQKLSEITTKVPKRRGGKKKSTKKEKAMR